MQNSVLLFGGTSEERLVSVASAQNMIAHGDFSEAWFIHPDGKISIVSKEFLLQHQNAFQVPFHPVDAPFANHLKDTISALKEKTVFIGLHGTEGEDGVFQGLFENAGILFTGSGSTSSRNAFEKNKSKSMVSKKGIQTAPELILTGLPEHRESELLNLQKFFKAHQKIVLKPLANGSSIGLHIISNLAELDLALRTLSACSYGSYLAEKFILGRELTVGVIDEGNTLRALPPSEIILNAGQSFDYQGKYLGKGAIEITPAALTDEQTARAQDIAKDAHLALACFGYSRTDMILTDDGFLFLETNTLPGLTKASFIPQQLAVAGILFQDFIRNQLLLAKAR